MQLSQAYDTLQKWIDALRSGEYIQGFGRLKSYRMLGSPCHCALGVAAEIDDRFTFTNQLLNEFKVEVLYQGRVWIGAYALPVWFEYPRYLMVSGLSPISLNDEHHLSFHQIANVIEFWKNDEFDNIVHLIQQNSRHKKPVFEPPLTEFEVAKDSWKKRLEQL